MGPRKRRPNKRYLEEDSEEEAGPSRRGRRPPSIDATQLDSEWQFPSLNEDTQPGLFLHSQPLTHDSPSSETPPGPFLHSQPLTHDSPQPRHCFHATPLPSQQLLRDSPSSETPPGPFLHSQPLTHATPLPSQQGNNQLLRDMGISTVIALLGQLREENRELKGEVGRLAQEVRALRREMGRQDTPQTSPLIKLPLSTMEEFLAVEALVKEDAKQKQLMVPVICNTCKKKHKYLISL
ncbi:uncharacterized protein LOC132886574 isoform X2 [Neoarius graeffei]|uniref:uncharacterized protein LOC132886574 isoform X2 n=1 Tax=Neoarius graeffei TaxID=443677 RepID=UPI00298C9E3A|nr:uncharacterized protein LOC132886574 isoform X2 [Neoarius graeffei]